MPTPTPDPACPGCAALRAEMAEMKEQFAAQLAVLEERLARAEENSSNSSKPPSSDIVQPPKPPSQERQKTPSGRSARPCQIRADLRQGLENLLTTECEAVLGHDCFSAYSYMENAPVTVQFCLAHLVRDLRFISESTNPYITAYGQRLIHQLKALFRLIHRRDRLNPETFQRRLVQIRDDFLQKARQPKAGGAAATLAKRFQTYGRDYFS